MSNALKAVSTTENELRVGNYLALYDIRDLEGLANTRRNRDGSIGEYFSKRTQFSSPYTDSGVLHVDWEHAQDDLDEDEVIGYVDWSTAKQTERGLWVQRVLNRRNQYVQWLEPLIKDGLIGTSSQAIGGSVKKDVDGEILRWPLKRDSLTVSPMQPLHLSENTLLTATKSFMGRFGSISDFDEQQKQRLRFELSILQNSYEWSMLMKGRKVQTV